MTSGFPDQDALFAAVDATWRPYSQTKIGPWTIREGRGGGKRVSAASTQNSVTQSHIEQAAEVMAGLGQTPLFMIQGEQDTLDGQLESAGYSIIDPVDILVAKSNDLAEYDQSELDAIFTPEPIAILAEIWADGEIYKPRLDVMRRVSGTKTCILGRRADKPVGAAFAAIQNGIALVHAVEVKPSARRQGVALRMMRAAAWWAQQNGAEFFGCLTTSENTPAQTLYRKMGMEVASHYHYRIKA